MSILDFLKNKPLEGGAVIQTDSGTTTSRIITLDETPTFISDLNQNLLQVNNDGSLSVKPKERIFAGETITTTDSYTNIRPVNGNFDTKLLAHKTFICANIDNKPALLTVKYTLDNTFYFVTQSNITLNASEIFLLDEAKAIMAISFEAKSKNVGQPTTLYSVGYGF